MAIHIYPAGPRDAALLAVLAGELLHEIMRAVGESVFQVNPTALQARSAEWLATGKTWMWLARDAEDVVGFVAAYEGHALYVQGTFGIVSELFVRPASRSQGIGAMLVRAVREFGQQRGWTRLEVTTPPLPHFDRTVAFYGKQGFAVTGGRKMKVGL